MTWTTDEALRDVFDVLVIGGGPAGSTAAIYAARAGLQVLVLHRGLATGALGWADRIANYPGIPEEIKGEDLIARMREQAEGFGARYVQDRVVSVDLRSEPKVATGNQGFYQGRTVVIATGAMGRSDQVPGEEEYLGRGVSYCATCDGAFFRDQVVAVAGNNNEAAEEALFLTRFADKIHFLVQTPEMLTSDELTAEVSNHEQIELHLATRLLEVVGNTEVTGVRIRPRGGEEQVLDVNGAFVYLQGRLPITDFVGDQLPRSEGGCLEANEVMQTQIRGVFAVGDVLCNHLKQVVVAAAEGAIAARSVERFLGGREQLRPDWH